MERLKGKYALITGGTSGIGLETARQFLAQGAHVAITGRNSEALASVQQELGSKVIAIKADSGNLSDLKKLADELAMQWPGIDIIYANAGDVTHLPLDTWTEESWDNSISVNLKGPFFLVQQLRPLLANPASIIFCGSTSAHIAFPLSSVYAAGKAGLLSLARTLSSELKGAGVRVNVLSPGPTETPALTKQGLPPEEQRKFEDNVRKLVPVGRMGTPWELAQAAIYLASDESRFVVGTELLVDGGVANL